MDKKFSHKLLELIVDKKLYNETWYYYLTGEWRGAFPDELKRWQIFLDFQRKLYTLLPSNPHCLNAEFLWQELAVVLSDLWVLSRLASIPG